MSAMLRYTFLTTFTLELLFMGFSSRMTKRVLGLHSLSLFQTASRGWFFTKRQNLRSAQINPFPNKPWFLLVCRTSLLKTLWEKEKWLVMSRFSFSHSVFYLFGELSAIFIKFEIVVCKLFQFGRV